MKRFILVAVILTGLGSVFGQNIQATFENRNLIEVFRQLEQQYDLTFAYDNDLISPLSLKKKYFEATDLPDLLDQILRSFPLKYRLTDQKYVLVSAREQSLSQKQDNAPPLPSICGYVTDAQTGAPLPFGNIVLQGAQQGTAANEKGYFSLQTQMKQGDTLEFTYLGYRALKIPVSQLLNSPCQTIALEVSGIPFSEILIRDHSISFLKPSRNGQGIALHPDQMGRLPGWGENDLLRMVQLLPGVHSSNESAADLHIRGGTPDQNLILWEDIPVLHIGHFFGLFTAVNPNIAESVKVYPGNFDASQGGRVSGLIDIRGPEAGDSLGGHLSLNLINAQAYVHAPFFDKKAGLQLAFRRSYTDLIQSPTYKKLFNQVAGDGKIEDNQQQAEEESLDALLSPTFYFTDLNAKWHFNLSPSTRWTSSFYRGSDHLDYLVLFDEPYFYLRSDDRIDLGNTGASTVITHEWSPRLTSNVKWIYSRFVNEYEFALNIRPQNEMENRWHFSQNNNMREIGLQWNNRWQWYPGQWLNFGYQRSAYQADFVARQQEPMKDEQRFEEDIEGALHSMYLDMDLNFQDRLLVDFGLRHIRYSPYKNFLLLPRLSVNVQPFSRFPLRLKGNVGRYTQFVNQMITDNDLGLSEQIWLVAGEEQGLPLVQSNQWSAGLRFQEKGWIVDAEFYEKETFNLTSLNLRIDPSQENPYSLGQADIRGFDLLIRKKWRHFNTWLSWSVGRVHYQFPALNDGVAFFADHDQRHTLNWTSLLEYPRWGVSFSWHFHTGQPFTLPEGVDTFFNLDTQEWDYQVHLPYRNSSRLPSYQRIDISAYWRWPAGRSYQFTGGLSVFNLLDRRNIRDKKYYVIPPDPAASRPARLFFYDQPALRLTPNVFLELKF